MASICVHRATRTPLDSTPGHIRSHDGLQEDHRPATHGRAGPAFPFPAIHLARQSPFYGPAGHIRSRDGIDLCPSSDPNPSRQHSRAHPLARWHRFVSIEHREPLQTALQGISARAMICRKKADLPRTCHARPCRHCIPLSCKSPDKAIAILRDSRAHPLARWHQFVSIERREPLQTALQGISARAMVCRKITDLPPSCHA